MGDLAIANANTNTANMILDGQSLNHMLAAAKLMSSATVTIPKHLQGNPGDCLAVIMQAMQWGMNPFTVAQKTHLVNGTLGYEAQLVNAVAQSSGAIIGAFSYEYKGEGDAMECRVGAVLRNTSEITWGEWLASKNVTVKNSPLWKTNPRQQIGYLQVKNWVRAYAPAALMGVYSVDELEEGGIRERDITPHPAPSVKNPMAIEQKEPTTLPPLDLDQWKTDISWITTTDQLTTKWQEIAGICAQHNSPASKAAYAEIKALVAKQGATLKAAAEQSRQEDEGGAE
ncbi:MAG TPA: RecT family recombinase [Pseudomonadales bacterium]|nr:RecT family recombinase [Pseudomonadales bacterium]